MTSKPKVCPWEEVPRELILAMLCKLQQKEAIKLTEVEIKGFRVGHIPEDRLKKDMDKVYENSPLIRDRVQKVLEAIITPVSENIKGIRISKLSHSITELYEEYDDLPVHLSLFLDKRKGVRKLAPELWEKNSKRAREETKEKAKECQANNDEAEQKRSQAEARAENLQIQAQKRQIAKLERDVVKLEKKIQELKQNYRRDIFVKDNYIQELKNKIKLGQKEQEYQEGRIGELNDILCEFKANLRKTEDKLSVAQGQIEPMKRETNHLRQENVRLQGSNEQLRAELDQIKKDKEDLDEELKSFEDIYNHWEDLQEDCSDQVALTGSLVCEGSHFWLRSKAGIADIPSKWVEEYSLKDGDTLEVSLNLENNGEVVGVRVIERSSGEELTGYIFTENGDYWAKCDEKKVYLGRQELIESGAFIDAVIGLMAYEKDQMLIGRITKIFDTEGNSQKARSYRPKIRKNLYAQENEATQESISLEGVKVLVVGGDNYKERYIAELEKKGATVDWHSGFEYVSSLPRKIMSNSLVLLLTSHISHTMTNMAKKAARKYSKKTLYYHGLSSKFLSQLVAENVEAMS